MKIEADPSTTVLWLRQQYSQKEGTPFDQVSFVFAGKELEQHLTVADLRLADDSILFATLPIFCGRRQIALGLLQIAVVASPGNTIALRVHPNATVGAVMGMIRDKAGVPCCSQYLFFAGSWLEDARTIEDCGILRNSTLHLLSHPQYWGVPPELLLRISSSDSTLTSLEIVGQHLGAAGSQTLADALSLNTCITSLSLHCSSVGPAGASVLLPAMTHLTALTFLCLSSTHLQSSGASHLCSALVHLTHLTQLDVGHNELTADDGARICGAAAAACMTRLKVLGLSGNPFTASCIVASEAWGQLCLPHIPYNFTAAATFTALTHCLMSSNSAAFTAAYHAALPPELLWRISSSDSTLTSLEIIGQHLGASESQALAGALSLNTCITSLSLHYSSVGPAGASVLLPAMTHLTALTFLCLSSTHLQSSGASHLCSALVHLTHLTQLDVGHNELTADDGARICGAAAAACMTRLKVLGLSGNPLAADNVVTCGSLAALTSLRVLHFDGAFHMVCVEHVWLNSQPVVLVDVVIVVAAAAVFVGDNQNGRVGCIFTHAATHSRSENDLDEFHVCRVLSSLLHLPNLSLLHLDHQPSACSRSGALQAAGIDADSIPPDIKSLGWTAVVCHLQQEAQLRFCGCSTRCCLRQLSVALQYRHTPPHPLTLYAVPGAALPARALPLARLHRLQCIAGHFGWFIQEFMPRDRRQNKDAREALLQHVCSAATASLLCDFGHDR